MFVDTKRSAVPEARGRGRGGEGGLSGSRRPPELINHSSFTTTASASSTPTASSSRVSSSISAGPQQESFKTTGHNRGSTTIQRDNVNINSSASAVEGYAPPSVTTTNAVTEETKRKPAAAFASEGKVNNISVQESLRLSDVYKTKGRDQHSSSHQRMLSSNPTDVRTSGGDMDSDTDPGLFNYIYIYLLYKS